MGVCGCVFVCLMYPEDGFTSTEVASVHSAIPVHFYCDVLHVDSSGAASLELLIPCFISKTQVKAEEMINSSLINDLQKIRIQTP